VTSFALGLHFLDVDEFAPGMRPAAQTLDAILRRYGVVAGIVAGHQVAAMGSNPTEVPLKKPSTVRAFSFS